ncbi:MAG: hypothetical protein WC238_04000 [Parcubacteria group bacterium]|jgi:hypothetical protein
MPNFGEKSISANRDRISENEASAEELKKQLAEANTTGDIDKVIELAGQAKTLKGQKEKFKDEDYEEAHAEVEMFDEAKAEDTDREQAKAKEKAAGELAEASDDLKKQIAEAITAEDYTRAAELGGKMKELMAGSTEEKVEDSQTAATQAKEELEELSRMDKEDSEKKVEEILKKINGEEVDEKSPTPEQVEKTESSFEQMKAQYNDVLEKIKIKNDQLQELDKKREELNKEKRTVEGTGNQQRLDEINKEFEEIYKQQEGIKVGEKSLELRRKQDEERKANKISIYDDLALKKRNKKFGEEHVAVYENSKNEDLGLDDLEYKKRKLILEFKKQNGYDETSAKEVDANFGYGAAKADMNRAVMNNFLGTNMPIFSKELKLGNKHRRSVGDREIQLISNSGPDGAYNQALIAKKQVELWQQATDAKKVVEGIPNDTLKQLIKENQLEYDAIMGESFVKDIYEPFLTTNASVNGEIIYPDKKSYPEDVKNYVDKEDSERGDRGYIFAKKAANNERWIKNVLFLQKIAKEKGLI